MHSLRQCDAVPRVGEEQLSITETRRIKIDMNYGSFYRRKL
jgi:hypothetical protein